MCMKGNTSNPCRSLQSSILQLRDGQKSAQETEVQQISGCPLEVLYFCQSGQPISKHQKLTSYFRSLWAAGRLTIRLLKASIHLWRWANRHNNFKYLRKIQWRHVWNDSPTGTLTSKAAYPNIKENGDLCHLKKQLEGYKGIKCTRDSNFLWKLVWNRIRTNELLTKICKILTTLSRQ